MAGIFIETTAISAITAAMGVASDMCQGIMDRFRARPIAASAVLVGHTVADLFRSAIGIVVMVGSVCWWASGRLRVLWDGSGRWR
jgi:ABC-2 type transport system permease protein